MFDAMVDRAFTKAGAAAQAPEHVTPTNGANAAENSPPNGSPALSQAFAAAGHRSS